MIEIQEIAHLHTSVRALVEFIFREGDIDNRGGRLASVDYMQEGSRIHRKIQKGKGENYRAEVSLKYLVEKKEYCLTIEGRADGIFTEAENEACVDWIDEIKGVCKSVSQMEEPVFVHKAQAMCYAYIYAREQQLSKIGVQMTYCHLETEEQRVFREIFTYSDIEEWFLDLLCKYDPWAVFECQVNKQRQESAKKLKFPFVYREGQKQLAVDVYRTIMRKKTLFLQAPTGVGKTISTIFPAIKAVGEKGCERIFYLTAKTITASVAVHTFEMLMQKGYKSKVLHITAKEKMCLCETMECNPQACPYAEGHYNRVNDALFELLNESDFFYRQQIRQKAKQHRVCPFELSLDAASFSCDIICDYNYVFDPNVYLKRFFQDGTQGEYVFLVDEAHNLVERSREMYSAELFKEDFMKMRKLFQYRNSKLASLLERANRKLLDFKRVCETYLVLEEIGSLYMNLFQLFSKLEEYLQTPTDIAERAEIMDFYFALRHFLNIYGLVDEHYVMYVCHTKDKRFMLRLFCVDPSKNLQNCLDRGRAAVYFSATLLPIQYYRKLLSSRTDDYAVYAKSVFEERQWLLLLGRDVTTKYTRRTEDGYRRIAEYIRRISSTKKGNYMVFFPSYSFMESVKDCFCEQMTEQEELLIQNTHMNEAEREEFLAQFHEHRENTLLAFCVLGGIFGEGIDLVKDRLIGVIVVGTGLPQVGDERELLKKYYDEQGMNGFDYAYRFPGFNKVLQAAGRVIRTPEDKGIMVLLDERFLGREYESLYPREWKTRQCCTLDTVQSLLEEFWK